MTSGNSIAGRYGLVKSYLPMVNVLLYRNKKLKMKRCNLRETEMALGEQFLELKPHLFANSTEYTDLSCAV
jgi:hypothetical protein